MSRRRAKPPNLYEREALFVFSIARLHSSPPRPSADNPPLFVAFGFIGDAYKLIHELAKGSTDMLAVREVLPSSAESLAIESGALENRGKLIDLLTALNIASGNHV